MTEGVLLLFRPSSFFAASISRGRELTPARQPDVQAAQLSLVAAVGVVGVDRAPIIDT